MMGDDYFSFSYMNASGLFHDADDDGLFHRYFDYYIIFIILPLIWLNELCHALPHFPKAIDASYL